MTVAEAVAGSGAGPKTIKNEAKCPYLRRLLLDSPSPVDDNVSPVVLPVGFPGTLVAEVLIS